MDGNGSINNELHGKVASAVCLWLLQLHRRYGEDMGYHGITDIAFSRLVDSRRSREIKFRPMPPAATSSLVGGTEFKSMVIKTKSAARKLSCVESLNKRLGLRGLSERKELVTKNKIRMDQLQTSPPSCPPYPNFSALSFYGVLVQLRYDLSSSLPMF
ncbi:hypothetical protein SDJN02_21038 [Cucurbita argyrosperma subsp. argyrosperma]|nr:hypothetical protein SDJN02_21038 [Cucurbita argyrosperma subsp. argyrosperma]